MQQIYRCSRCSRSIEAVETVEIDAVETVEENAVVALQAVVFSLSFEQLKKQRKKRLKIEPINNKYFYFGSYVTVSQLQVPRQQRRSRQPLEGNSAKNSNVDNFRLAAVSDPVRMAGTGRRLVVGRRNPVDVEQCKVAWGAGNYAQGLRDLLVGLERNALTW